MLPIEAIVVDFDGTACLDDVAARLLERFGDPGWERWDERWERGEVSGHAVLTEQLAMLRADRDTMTRFAVEQCTMDPTFRPFVSWAESHDIPVEIASDGFAFYIPPLLQREGLGHLEVHTNRSVFDHDAGPARIEFPNRNDGCARCGTCKMATVQRVRREYGHTAFVGEGSSDRYGAFYADVVFAKDTLVDHCRRAGVPFLPYEDFEDVRAVLEEIEVVPGAVEPPTCPGWMPV
jgi:2,3-diketo-5-methylthio-1-phosphopentane phosphatase